MEMKITVLMEDTPGAAGLPAEHGLSLFIGTARHTLLMDTGASALTWDNADTLGIDVSKADTVVISHGHYDHAGGLMALAKKAPGAEIYMRASAFGQYYHGDKYIGIDPAIAGLPHLHLIEETGMTAIDSELSLFSGVTGRTLWPKGNRALTELRGGVHGQDTFAHEQSLVISAGGKRVLLSGCAHCGIVNILKRFRRLYGGCPDAVISGFHMMKTGEYTAEETEDILNTARALAEIPCDFYTGHCTGAAAFDIMKPVMGEKLIPLHAGDTITL